MRLNFEVLLILKTKPDPDWFSPDLEYIKINCFYFLSNITNISFLQFLKVLVYLMNKMISLPETNISSDRTTFKIYITIEK